MNKNTQNQLKHWSQALIFAAFVSMLFYHAATTRDAQKSQKNNNSEFLKDGTPVPPPPPAKSPDMFNNVADTVCAMSTVRQK